MFTTDKFFRVIAEDAKLDISTVKQVIVSAFRTCNLEAMMNITSVQMTPTAQPASPFPPSPAPAAAPKPAVTAPPAGPTQTVGEWMRDVRLSMPPVNGRPMIQGDFGDLIGYTQLQVSLFERDQENLTIQQVQEIADALGIPAPALLIRPEAARRMDEVLGMLAESDKEVAKACGVNVRTVQAWRDGLEVPSLTARRALIHGLGISPSKFKKF